MDMQKGTDNVQGNRDFEHLDGQHRQPNKVCFTRSEGPGKDSHSTVHTVLMDT
jgi:hypothetical protein